MEIEAARRWPEIQVNGGAEGPSRPRTKGGAEVGCLAFSVGGRKGEAALRLGGGGAAARGCCGGGGAAAHELG
jgi:hypothetical protein